jgi:N-acetylmuramoyl-L-alanine amidase
MEGMIKRMSNPNKAVTICIDPGHTGIDPGATNGSRHEADDNLKLALVVSGHIVKQGHKTILTHKGDIPKTRRLELEARTQIAINCKAGLFVSLHRNSVPDTTANGIEIWTRYPASLQAASDVYDAIHASSGMRNRGMKVGAYKVLYNLPMPAMMLETGFISNPGDNLLYDQRFSQNAEAIAKGILAAVGAPWNSMPANPYWRVQVGAFAVRENADRFMAKVQADGFPAFLVYYEERKLWRVQVGAFGVRDNADRYLKQIQDAGHEAFIVAPCI